MSALQTCRVAGIVLLAGLSALSGCSNRQLYEAVQQNRLNDCEKYTPEQRQQCREYYQMSYEQYERERQRALERSAASQ